MKVSAIKCKKCNCIIYSRARHDMHWCDCGKCAIDGGQEEGYIQITGNKDDWEFVNEVEVAATKSELFNDWNKDENKFGVIRPN